MLGQMCLQHINLFFSWHLNNCAHISALLAQGWFCSCMTGLILVMSGIQLKNLSHGPAIIWSLKLDSLALLGFCPLWIHVYHMSILTGPFTHWATLFEMCSGYAIFFIVKWHLLCSHYLNKHANSTYLDNHSCLNIRRGRSICSVPTLVVVTVLHDPVITIVLQFASN